MNSTLEKIKKSYITSFNLRKALKWFIGSFVSAYLIYATYMLITLAR